VSIIKGNIKNACHLLMFVWCLKMHKEIKNKGNATVQDAKFDDNDEIPLALSQPQVLND
jgi:hypothetical protein